MQPNFGPNQQQPWDNNKQEVDAEKFERFELLSAYIDGEVTPAERYQVQNWIDADPEFKRVYLRLIRLQTAIPHIPFSPSIDTDTLSQRVWEKIETQNRWHTARVWSSITVAAVLIAACSSVLINPFQPSLQQARLNEGAVNTLDEESLDIAISESMLAGYEISGESLKSNL